MKAAMDIGPVVRIRSRNLSETLVTMPLTRIVRREP